MFFLSTHHLFFQFILLFSNNFFLVTITLYFSSFPLSQFLFFQIARKCFQILQALVSIDVKQLPINTKSLLLDFARPN